MMRQKLKRPLAGVLLALILAAGWFVTLHAAPGESDSGVLITEYPIPFAGSEPRNLRVTSSGKIWFTMYGAGAVGLLQVTPTGDYSFTRYDTPTPESRPYDLVVQDGLVWFTEYAGNNLARLDTTTGEITEFPLPTPDSHPTGIDISSTGRVWFVTESGDTIGYFDPDVGEFTEFTHPNLVGAQLSDVAVFDNNSIWVTAPGRQEIFNYAPTYNLLIPLYPGTGSQPNQVALEGNNPWITDKGNQRIGRYAPGTLTFWRWYEINSSNVGLAGIAYRSIGNNRQVWFTEQNSNRVGQLVVDGNTGYVTRFWRQTLPTLASQPAGIDIDVDGTAWIAESQGNAIAAWRSPYYDLPIEVFSPLFTDG